MNSIPLEYISSIQKYNQLSKLLELDWAMLLDSGSIPETSRIANELIYRRFDIFTCKPTIHLTYDDGKLTIEEKSTKITTADPSPLATMKIISQKYTKSYNLLDLEKTSLESPLPFNGGWLGYISYDFGFTLQPNHKKLFPKQFDCSKSTNKTPNIPMIRMGLYQWALITDHQEKTSMLYNFGLDSTEWDKLQTFVLTKLNAAQETPSTTNNSKSETKLKARFKSNLSYQNYQQSFDKIQNYIKAGDCYQVNFSQSFNSQFRGNPFGLYRELAIKNNSPFSAYLNFGQQQILSLSPERFIQSNNKNISTQPIKGTLPRDPDPIKDALLAEELINSEKDRAENLMIVDLLRNDLSKTAKKGSVKVTELFGHYKFESVHHLISTIESKLDDQFDNFDLLATTLPGGSITGAPKIRAMQIIDELESNNRGIYCGIIGYIDFKGNMDTNICIRTLVTEQDQIYCWAGGGQVADSQLDLEYQETFDKLNKIIPVLHSLSDLGN